MQLSYLNMSLFQHIVHLIRNFFSGHPGSQGLHSDDFDFTDITEAIKNNNTGVELAKRVLSKLAKLTERSGDSNSLFMMWTIPTTILALMGIVYFVGMTYNLELIPHY